jgi:ABC-type lipoprotein export system ATPase subunit
MIRARGVHKSFRTGKTELPVLRGVDLEVADGEFVAVVGRSGSGKSTLLGILGGLDTDYRGEVEVGGQDLRKLSDARLSAYRNASIGFVFQAFHLLDHLSCIDNVALPAMFVRGAAATSDTVARARAQELLERVGIPEKASAKPSTLSGGQKQRLAIARALFHRPALLIGDEPTGNLDSTTAEDVLSLFTRLCRDDKVTLVLVTHDPTIARAADRIIEMRDGLIAPVESAPSVVSEART